MAVSRYLPSEVPIIAAQCINGWGGLQSTDTGSLVGQATIHSINRLATG
jgi:hypothetical protein